MSTIVALEIVMHEKDINRIGLTTNRGHRCLKCAEDIALLAKNLPELIKVSKLSGRLEERT